MLAAIVRHQRGYNRSPFRLCDAYVRYDAPEC